MHIRIKNGRIIDPANDVDQMADLYIGSGEIVAIGQEPDGFVTHMEIDASDKIVCPGLVDLSVQMREPGDLCKATIATETRAAVAGGITALCCPPDTSPVIDSTAVVELIHQRSEQSGMSRVYCLGALTHGLQSERLAEMFALKQAGCVGVSNGLQAIGNNEVMLRALEYAATCDLTVFLNPQDKWLSQIGQMHEGAYSTRMGIPPISEAVETVAIARDLLLIEETGVSAHFMRLSSARGVQMIREAQQRGLPVTADVAIHHLHFTDKDAEDYNSLCHVKPPFRHHTDKEKLIEAVANGTISAICSDHQPLDNDEKTAPFSVTDSGISSVDVLLSLGLKLVNENKIDLPGLLKILTIAPAEILGIQAGSLSIGMPADVCIFDQNARWKVTPDSLLSVGKNTPTLGSELPGKVVRTLVNGHLVYEGPES